MSKNRDGCMGKFLNAVYSLTPNGMVQKFTGTPYKAWYDTQEDESLLPKINFSTTPCGLIYDETDDLSSEEELPIFVDEGAITVLSMDEIRSMKPNFKQFHQTFADCQQTEDTVDTVDNIDTIDTIDEQEEEYEEDLESPLPRKTYDSFEQINLKSEEEEAESTNSTDMIEMCNDNNI